MGGRPAGVRVAGDLDAERGPVALDDARGPSRAFASCFWTSHLMNVIDRAGFVSTESTPTELDGELRQAIGLSRASHHQVLLMVVLASRRIARDVMTAVPSAREAARCGGRVPQPQPARGVAQERKRRGDGLEAVHPTLRPRRLGQDAGVPAAWAPMSRT